MTLEERIAWASRQVGTGSSRYVLVMLAVRSDEDGRLAFKREQLADDIRIARSVLDRHLRNFRRLGYLRRAPMPPRLRRADSPRSYRPRPYQLGFA